MRASPKMFGKLMHWWFHPELEAGKAEFYIEVISNRILLPLGIIAAIVCEILVCVGIIDIIGGYVGSMLIILVFYVAYIGIVFCINGMVDPSEGSLW